MIKEYTKEDEKKNLWMKRITTATIRVWLCSRCSLYENLYRFTTTQRAYCVFVIDFFFSQHLFVILFVFSCSSSLLSGHEIIHRKNNNNDKHHSLVCRFKIANSKTRSNKCKTTKSLCFLSFKQNSFLFFISYNQCKCQPVNGPMEPTS